LNEDWEFDNLRYLGGQIAAVDHDFQEICTTDPNMAIAIWFFKNIERWEKEEDDNKFFLEALQFLGKVNRTKFFSEITIISAILGERGEANREWDTTAKRP
jgi:hypothetical protein